VIMKAGPNKSVQATAAPHFRFVACLVFLHSSCRPQSPPAAVPDLDRWMNPET
jgi:hypothetical protein